MLNRGPAVFLNRTYQCIGLPLEQQLGVTCQEAQVPSQVNQAPAAVPVLGSKESGCRVLCFRMFLHASLRDSLKSQGIQGTNCDVIASQDWIDGWLAARFL